MAAVDAPPAARDEDEAADEAADDAEAEDDDAHDTYIPVIQDGRQITFKLGTLTPFLSCRLCDGYLVDAMTITECMHTFCKSCIFKFLSDNDFCPMCQQELGPNPTEQLRKDSAIQTIVYKLVPGLQKRVEDERESYMGQQGQGLKRPADAEGGEGEAAARKAATTATPALTPASTAAAAAFAERPDEQISFVLKLDDQWVMSHKDAHERIPPEKMAKLKELDRPYIKTSARATVLTLKKFLLSKLRFDSPNDLDICLNGEVLGPELSLEFVQKTRAIDPNGQLVLKYRPNIGLL